MSVPFVNMTVGEIQTVSEIKDKIEQIAAHYTFHGQRRIYIEECAEAIQATAKLNRMNTETDLWEHFIEETADNLNT